MSFGEGLVAFFPLQLVMAHLKYNLLALGYWTFLFLIITDNIGSKFGVPLLFFSPEYLGNVSAWSFLFMGFAIGGFTMGFNTYSYIRLGSHFSFLATLNQPFYKFCINNSPIPIAFNITFMIVFSRFQIREEFATGYDVLLYNLFYIGGFIFFQLLSILYFFPMNRRVERSILDPSNDPERESIVKTIIPNKENFPGHNINQKERTYIYLGKRLRFHSSRSGKHYSKELLNHIYRKNKVNATLFETLAILSFLTLGIFSGFRYFEIPAAVSIVLLLTIILMLFSSLLSWLNRWAYPILILVFLTMNYLSLHSPFFTFKNYAYGLSYEKETEYSVDNIEKISNSDIYKEKTKVNILRILENWKSRTGKSKPKLILIDVSGGGSRSALWSLSCMQNLDKALNGEFSQHTQMITGASGGMIGAAYYREIHRRFLNGTLEDPFDNKYKDNIASDLLNKLSFSASTNDIFFRYQHITVGKNSYPKDRGTAFENELHENTEGLMDVNLNFYKKPEADGIIPLMIFSPTIVNDGRRLLISAQSLNFLTESKGGPSSLSKSFENIDYLSFFKDNQPDSIRFSSVLRASATFPFVMPMMTMPTNPQVQLMDAGIRDNYGGKVTMEYMNVLSDWIKKNTSGVVIVQIRDTKKVLDNETYQEVSLLDKFTLPFGNMYSNFTRTQDFDQEQLMMIGAKELPFPVDLISFNLRENKKDKISLSWHLTKQEKKKINEAFQSARNQQSLNQLRRLLKE
ncbi:MAG: patatin-like phospholipase family protein [Crocinitomicaceae bacterium]